MKPRVPLMCKLLCSILFVSMIISAEALGDTSVTDAANGERKNICMFPQSKERAPNWICDAHTDTAVGSAVKSDAGIAFMEEMAVAEARTQLAQILQKNTSDSDIDSTVKIINKSLPDTALMESTYGPDGTLYVLVGRINAKVINPP